MKKQIPIEATKTPIHWLITSDICASQQWCGNMAWHRMIMLLSPFLLTCRSCISITPHRMPCILSLFMTTGEDTNLKNSNPLDWRPTYCGKFLLKKRASAPPIFAKQWSRTPRGSIWFQLVWPRWCISGGYRSGWKIWVNEGTEAHRDIVAKWQNNWATKGAFYGWTIKNSHTCIIPRISNFALFWYS